MLLPPWLCSSALPGRAREAWESRRLSQTLITDMGEIFMGGFLCDKYRESILNEEC